MSVEAIKRLHTALVDTRGAYELALKDTEDADVARICREMISLRHEDHMALHQALILAGEKPDENGSFMSLLHETVIGVRAALSGISKKTLPAFTGGEEDIIKLYDEALSESDGNPPMSDILSKQRATLNGKIAEMRALAP